MKERNANFGKYHSQSQNRYMLMLWERNSADTPMGAKLWVLLRVKSKVILVYNCHPQALTMLPGAN